MTRMTGPDCAVMCNLINTHTQTHTQYSGGFLPEIMLLTLCYYYHSLWNPIKCHEEVLSLHPMFPPKRFDNFFSCLGNTQKV